MENQAKETQRPLLLPQKELIAELFRLRREKDKLKLQLSDINKQIVIHENELVTCMNLENQLATAKYEFGYIIKSKKNFQAKVAPENKQKLHEWLQSRGAEELIKPTIHPATLNAYCLNAIECGEELPQFISQLWKPTLRYMRAEEEDI